MTLVDDLRQMVSAGTAEYSVNATSYWSDAQLQTALDHHRKLLNFEQIEWMPYVQAGGSLAYTRGEVCSNYALIPGTAGGTVQNAGGTAVSSWTLDRDGYISFAADSRGSAYFFTGWSYDMNAAAAEICENWATSLKGLVDVQSDDQQLKLSQKVQTLKDMAAGFRGRQPLVQGGMRRGDAK